jgi:hypothetical protein
VHKSDTNAGTFRIVYDGPALATHTMDVRELAPALMALAEVLEHANRVLNGERAHVTVKVSGSFKTGSFGVDFEVLQSFVAQALDFFAEDKRVVGTLNLLALVGIIGGASGGLIKLIKWLRGRAITRVEIADDNSAARIVVEDESTEVEIKTIELFRNYQVRQSLEKVVKNPLDRDGVESVAFIYNEEVTETVTKSERTYYSSPSADQPTPVETQEFRARLQLVSVPMRDGYKWRVDDGNGVFTATLLDEDFARRLQANEVPLTPGDLLVADVRRGQYMEKGQLKTNNELVKIVNHVSAYQSQIPLPIYHRGVLDKPDKNG